MELIKIWDISAEFLVWSKMEGFLQVILCWIWAQLVRSDWFNGLRASGGFSLVSSNRTSPNPQLHYQISDGLLGEMNLMKPSCSDVGFFSFFSFLSKNQSLDQIWWPPKVRFAECLNFNDHKDFSTIKDTAAEQFKHSIKRPGPAYIKCSIVIKARSICMYTKADLYYPIVKTQIQNLYS